MGREFQGEAFKPAPAVILFKDFEVGQSYSQVITLTNISLARNTFKASHPHHSHARCDHLHPYGSDPKELEGSTSMKIFAVPSWQI